MAIKGKMGTEIIREVMKEEGYTQKKLADALGYRSNSAVAGRLSTPHISAEKLVEMLGAMGYEVIVRKAEDEEDTERKEWRVVG